MAEIGRSIPKRLGKEPLLEALWEIRFTSNTESVADLLPGLIYKDMRAEFPKIERLPVSNLPSTIVQQDAALRYVPSIRLEGKPYSIQIGERVVSLSCRRPYTGWGAFESKILKLAKMLRGTNLLTRPERFSLKYIDIIPFGDVIPLTEIPSLKPLQVVVKLGDHELTTNPVHLRTELRENGFLHIVQIASRAQAVLSTGEHFEGLLIDIDTIYHQETGEFWDELKSFRQLLNRAHQLNKKLFFHILTKETEINLEAEY